MLVRWFFLLVLGVGFAFPASAGERTKAELRAIKKEMKQWSKALGVKCRHCHNPKDFSQWSAEKRVADAMNKAFVHQLKHPKTGGKLACGDCHSGSLSPDAEKLKAFAKNDLKGLSPLMEKLAKEAPEVEAQERLKAVLEVLKKM